MTYSIVARDPATGEIGIAVASRYFGAGRIVPFAAAGIGVVASQSFANPAYGVQGLAALADGAAPEAVLARLVAADAGAALRQVAILDAAGRVAVHTGARNVAAAGHAIGEQCAAQANMMARPTVWHAMRAAFAATAGPLAERLVAALGAAEGEGGDMRGRQAGALVVVAGTAEGGRLVDLRVDDHPDPAVELGRLLAYQRALDRADRARSVAAAGELAAALALVDESCASHPGEPEFLTRRAFLLLALDRPGEARAAMARACAVHPGWADYARRLADAGHLPLPRGAIEALVAGFGTDG